MSTFYLPDIFQTDSKKRDDLFTHLVKHSKPALPQHFPLGARVFVLSGSPGGAYGVTKTSTEYLAATVIEHLPFPYSSLRLTWDDGQYAGWHLDPFSKVVDAHVLEKYVEVKNVPIEIDTTHLDKLVLAGDSKQELVAVLQQHKYMNKIFKEWGLDEVMEYGKAMSLLFYGGPGTGKTWAANCIAKALGKELLIISSAEIETSEPGGAERNIQEAFKQAKSKSAVLFLDECDGLITDRKHVGMIVGAQINCLLTCLEKFEGTVIFATNRADTLDPAMERRISLMLEFPDPDEQAREAIWKVLLPSKMPLEKGVTPAKLAKFDLTGGYIKNVILNAARYAASEESPHVGREHFAKAIKRVKKGKGIMGSHTSRGGVTRGVVKG